MVPEMLYAQLKFYVVSNHGHVEKDRQLDGYKKRYINMNVWHNDN